MVGLGRTRRCASGVVDGHKSWWHVWRASPLLPPEVSVTLFPPVPTVVTVESGRGPTPRSRDLRFSEGVRGTKSRRQAGVVRARVRTDTKA